MNAVERILDFLGNDALLESSKLVGSQKKVKGYILFSYNEKTGEWKQADVKRNIEIGLDGLPVYKAEITKEPNCIYIQALNLDNAKKRLKKL